MIMDALHASVPFVIGICIGVTAIWLGLHDDLD